MSNNKMKTKNYKQFSISKLEDALVSLGSLISGVVINLKKYSNPENPANVIIHWMSNKGTFDYIGLWEQLNNENNNLRMKIHTYDDVISQNNLSAFFHFQKEI